jgi:LPXTG-motif cell wall-anchored protein
MISKRVGLLAVVIAAAVMWAIPAVSSARSLELQQARDALRQVTAGLGNAVQKTVAKTDEALRKTREKADTALKAKAKSTDTAGTRATATDPPTQPPLHGTDPHAQGSVAVVDIDPTAERPVSGDPTGKASGEDAVVGRARGEKVNGAYHGHITIASLFGSELLGVDSNPGEDKHGPLQPLQTGVLDPLCDSTNGQICLSVLTANSKTTASGSSNDFAVARASLLGLGVGAAESQGVIAEDKTCQTSVGRARTANVVANGGGAIAQVANSSSTSKSCVGQAPQVTNTSQVIGLGGVQVPLPAAGCADGTPDTVSGIPGILPIVCNAEDIVGAAAVREALDVFVLQTGSTALAKETTGASESVSVAPPAPPETGPQCSDKIDNDGDGVIDAADPGCHSDNNPKNDATYNPADNDETDKTGGGNGGGGKPQCADGIDNDGDGLVDAKDGGCHTDGKPGNPDSYNPKDDDESGGGGNGGGGGGNGGGGGGNGGGNGAPTGSGQSTGSGALPFTGSDVIGLSLAGLLMLGGGLLLRRREDTHGAL